MRTHALLAGREQVDRKQPLVKRDMAVLKNSLHGYCKLLLAWLALPQTF